MSPMNIWPILVAAIAAFAVGALWYSPVLFGKEWMALMKIGEREIAAAKSRGMWGLYLTQFVFTLITYAVLAFMIAASGATTAGDGAFLGFLVWLGFSLPIGISRLLWEQQPFRLLLINMVNLLIVSMIGGAIIGGWR